MKFVILLCIAIVGINALPAGKESDRDNEIDQLVNRPEESVPSSTEIPIIIPDGSQVTYNAQPPYIQGDVDLGINAKPAGTTFARLIDDIFQIPITVLQSVAKLLTNPFKSVAVNQSPEETHTY